MQLQSEVFKFESKPFENSKQDLLGNPPRTPFQWKSWRRFKPSDIGIFLPFCQTSGKIEIEYVRQE